MNSIIIEQFDLLIKQIQAEYLNAQVDGNDKEAKIHQFRLQQIKKILSIIKNLDFAITDSNQLKGIPNIGEGTIRRINEILQHGHLSELHNKYDPKKQKEINSIQELSQIIGVGDKLARKLVVLHKIKSIKDLKSAINKKKIIVNDKIKLGLKYFGVVKGKIPRNETKKVEIFLNKQIKKIDNDLNLIICGSYRRGKETSNDFDILIYHPSITSIKQIHDPETHNVKAYLELFVNYLSKKGYLLDHMTDKNYKMKYMGFFQYKNFDVRRMDIRIVPYKSLPAAMLYYTGPFELNKFMRTEAIKRNMLLNEYGLYKIDEDGKKKAFKIKSEKDIFKKLGMDYLTPEERETFDLGKQKKINTNIS
jgi:DNA polymerase/3'-5' exonuclease PolX